MFRILVMLMICLMAMLAMSTNTNADFSPNDEVALIASVGVDAVSLAQDEATAIVSEANLKSNDYETVIAMTRGINSAAFGGGSLFDRSDAAKLDPGPTIDAVACRPLRWLGGKLRGGVRAVFGARGSC